MGQHAHFRSGCKGSNPEKVRPDFRLRSPGRRPQSTPCASPRSSPSRCCSQWQHQPRRKGLDRPRAKCARTTWRIAWPEWSTRPETLRRRWSCDALRRAEPQKTPREPRRGIQIPQGVPRFPHSVLGEQSVRGQEPLISTPEPSSPNGGRKRNRMRCGEKKDALGAKGAYTPRASRDSRALVGTRPSAAVPILKPGAERGNARPPIAP